MLKSSHRIIQTYPYSFRVSSHFPHILKNLRCIYPEELVSCDGPADFNVAVNMPVVSGLPLFRRALFSLDGFAPFTRGPSEHGHALLEWGMNWCVSRYGADRLIIHAACVSRGPDAILLSGDSGSGKSTLSCVLMHESYRLLTDELSLINLGDGSVTPFVRPVSLKDNAIRVVQERYPSAKIGRVAHNTHKGTVSHCKPSQESWKNMTQSANIKGIIFPKFDASAAGINIRQMDPIESFSKLSEQAFNIHILGTLAINRLQHICETVPAFEIEYSCTDEALNFVNELYEKL